MVCFFLEMPSTFFCIAESLCHRNVNVSTIKSQKFSFPIALFSFEILVSQILFGPQWIGDWNWRNMWMLYLNFPLTRRCYPSLDWCIPPLPLLWQNGTVYAELAKQRMAYITMSGQQLSWLTRLDKWKIVESKLNVISN